MKTPGDIAVGDWLLDPASHVLKRGSTVVHLEPKASAVLAFLAANRGRVVSRDELFAAVWPGVVVTDETLSQAIIKLRKRLGDDARAPRYIETIPKGGYRLIDAVVTRARPRVRGRQAAPVVIAALAVAAIVAWNLRPAPAPSAIQDAPVVAVLPFTSAGGAEDRREYLTDGMTEEIINALGRFSGLRVISFGSVAAYKSRPATAPEIRGSLGAGYVVKGSIREAQGILRVAVQLTESSRGVVLWSERYEAQGEQVFEMQDRIVKSLAGALAVKVGRLEQERVLSKPPRSLEAYDLVLQARALLVRYDRAANRRARELLGRALELAPAYADAHVEMGRAESQRANFGWVEDPSQALGRSEQALLRALAIDDPGAHARAHALLGMVYAAQTRFDRSLHHLDQALALNPSDAFVHDLRGGALVFLGRTDEGIAALENGLRLNPLGRGSDSGFNLALGYYTVGRYGDALATADASLARENRAPFVHAIRAATLARMGIDDEARRAAAEVRRLEPFFKADQFGNRFAVGAHREHLAEGLRRAGL